MTLWYKNTYSCYLKGVIKGLVLRKSLVMKKIIPFLLLVLLIKDSFSQSSISRKTYQQILAVSPQSALFEGRLTMVNIFRQQIKVAYETYGQPDAIVRRAFIEQTYLPYKSFWEGYVGDSSVYYEDVIRPLLKDSAAMLDRVALMYANARIDKYFSKTASLLSKLSGLRARGTWFIAFGHGVTDMGGFGNGEMVLDLSNKINTLEHVELILPHEFNHQIYDFSVTEDTTARGLYRCINEGFAVYMNQVVLKKKYSLADYLMYTPDELAYCMQNEKKIINKLKPFLFTSNKDHARALASRGDRIFKDGGPGAIGYFIGYRICQTYVEKHGKDSWKDLYRLPVREVWEKSGYDEKFKS